MTVTANKINNQTFVEINGLCAGYNGEMVLQDINFTIYDGDFIGLIGPNGGGKTTLLKIILGLLPPQKGSITVMGKSPQEGRRHIGYVPQFAEFDSDFPISVRDVVRMGRLNQRKILKPFTADDAEIVEQRLEWVDMLDHKERSMRELSGGQRQRIYIARALSTKPAILMLDEPTNSVDYESRTKIYDLLHRINEQGVTILMVSHDLNVISSYVKTIGCLNRQMHYHGEKEITTEMLNAGYHCPVELIAHGLPHRVLADHEEAR